MPDLSMRHCRGVRAAIASRWLAAILTATLWYAPAGAAVPARATAAAGSIPAVWVTRHVEYVYRGTTALYTCDGLKSEIEHLLTRLGARHLRVQECGVTDRLILFPSVRVTWQALLPARPGGSAPTVAARWRRIRLFPQMRGGGSCELIEEFRRTFLPLFAARHIDMSATCVPHHQVPGNHLYADVLTADPPAPGSR